MGFQSASHFTKCFAYIQERAWNLSWAQWGSLSVRWRLRLASNFVQCFTYSRELEIIYEYHDSSWRWRLRLASRFARFFANRGKLGKRGEGKISKLFEGSKSIHVLCANGTDLHLTCAPVSNRDREPKNKVKLKEPVEINRTKAMWSAN